MSSYLSIDPAYLAKQYTQVEKAPKEAQLNHKSKIYNDKLRSIKSLKSQLTSFHTKVEQFQKESLLVNSSKSSQESVVTISSDGNAVTGRYQVFVEQLAQSHQIALPFNDADALPTDGAIELEVAGEKFSLDLASLPADAKLSDLAQAINNHADNKGVNATVMRQGKTTYLMLSSKESGLKNSISLKHVAGAASSENTNFATAVGAIKTLTQAKDAKFRLGSNSALTLTNSSNTITDVIDGVTLELKKAQGRKDSPVQLEVSSDKAATKEKIQSFVDEVNSMVSLISDNDTLSRDSTARGIKNQIRATFQGKYAGSTLYNMGLEFDRNGQLQINSTRLEKSLTESPQKLAQMFSAEDGLLDKIETTIKPYKGSLGLLQDKQKTIQSSLDLIAKKRERLNISMDMVYKRYLSQFTHMQVTIAQLESSMNSFGQ